MFHAWNNFQSSKKALILKSEVKGNLGRVRKKVRMCEHRNYRREIEIKKATTFGLIWGPMWGIFPPYHLSLVKMSQPTH